MDAFEYIDIFIQSGLFINVELNHAGELNDIFFNPNDPRFNEQWYLKQSSNKDIDAEKAWTITKGDSSKVRIYVIDSGIKLFGASIYHEDLIDVNHIKIGKNFTVSPANNIIQDSTTSGHGTRVAGLLGAVHNSVGIAGIAPRCEIIVHKVTRTTSGTPFANATISAINDATMWKISNPSRNVVVNLSLAFSNHNNELRIAIESARQYKVICVCGAGNDTGFVLKVVVYPIGAIFNGEKKFTLQSRLYSNRKIYGGSKIGMLNLDRFTLDHDAAAGTGADSVIGYGRYRVTFFRLNGQNYDSVDYCDVDFSDADYPLLYPADITLKYFSSTDIRFIFFEAQEYAIGSAGRYLKIWDQYGGVIHREQNKNGFKTSYDSQVLPINARDSGATQHLSPNTFYVDLNVLNSSTSIIQNAELDFSNCGLNVKDGFNLSMGNNSKIVLINSSHFRTFQNSGVKTVFFGSNASIELNGGSVNLNNTKFELANGASSWKGIKLTNTGLDTIKNCTFSGADTIIRIQNSDKCFARNKKIITGSRFNNGIVKLSNVFRALISNDTFSTINSSHYLLTVSNSVHPNDENIFCDEEESPSPMFNLNITCNVIEMKPENQEL